MWGWYAHVGPMLAVPWSRNLERASGMGAEMGRAWAIRALRRILLNLQSSILALYSNVLSIRAQPRGCVRRHTGESSRLTGYGGGGTMETEKPPDSQLKLATVLVQRRNFKSKTQRCLFLGFTVLPTGTMYFHPCTDFDSLVRALRGSICTRMVR